MNAPVSFMKPVLQHTVIGPDKAGIYHVIYTGDHTRDVTAISQALSLGNAQKEADRLNDEQVAKEQSLQMELALRQFRRIV